MSVYEEVMENKSLIRFYANNSFDRFGDDLTELILQYLTFEDKVRLECVSKQWRRLIYNKQIEINIWTSKLSPNSGQNNSFDKLVIPLLETDDWEVIVNPYIIELLLKKCPNISRVHLPYISIVRSNKELDVLNKYCRRITKLYLPYNERVLLECVTKHRKWLEELVITNRFHLNLVEHIRMINLIKMCPNIKKINIRLEHDFPEMFDGSDTLMKLEVIGIVFIGWEQSNRLELLVNKYGTSLKGLKVVFKWLSSDELKTCFAHISRFESLQSLELLFNSCDIKERIDNCLKLFANKCTKLRELRIKTSSDYRSVILNRIFYAFTDFRSLDRLVVDFQELKNKLEGSVKCLKHCTQLKHLSITHSELTEDFFANIQITLPNLRYLNINSKQITGQSVKPFIESLQKMKSIERVVVNTNMEFYYQKNRLESKPRILVSCD